MQVQRNCPHFNIRDAFPRSCVMEFRTEYLRKLVLSEILSKALLVVRWLPECTASNRTEAEWCLTRDTGIEKASNLAHLPVSYGKKGKAFAADAMKAHRRSRGIASLILNLGTKQKCVVPRYPLRRAVWRRENSLAPVRIRTPDRPVRSLATTPTSLLQFSCITFAISPTHRGVSFVNALLLGKNNRSCNYRPQALGSREAINCVPWTPYWTTPAAPGNSRVVPIKT
jgi:hypothetical protein